MCPGSKALRRAFGARRSVQPPCGSVLCAGMTVPCCGGTCCGPPEEEDSEDSDADAEAEAETIVEEALIATAAVTEEI